MVTPLKKALALAEDAEQMGYLNAYPRACVLLAKEVKRLQKALDELNGKIPTS